MSDFVLVVGIFIVSFLLGSIPFGLIISKLFFHTDIRSSGSGNIGTTNALRTMGKAGGAAVFVLDFGKGLLSGCIASILSRTMLVTPDPSSVETLADSAWMIDPATCLAAAFAGCVLGHIFSPWLHFHGGKGIAVAVGCLFFTFGPLGAVLELALFAVIVIFSRYVSLGSLAAALTCPLFALYFLWGHWLAVILVTIGAACVVWAHRGNIERLRNGTERRIGGLKEGTA